MRLALSYPITPVTASDSKLAVTSHASTGLGKQAEPSTKRARPQSLPRKYSPRAGYRQATFCDKSRPVFVPSAGATKDALVRSSGALGERARCRFCGGLWSGCDI